MSNDKAPPKKKVQKAAPAADPFIRVCKADGSDGDKVVGRDAVLAAFMPKRDPANPSKIIDHGDTRRANALEVAFTLPGAPGRATRREWQKWIDSVMSAPVRG